MKKIKNNIDVFKNDSNQLLNRDNLLRNIIDKDTFLPDSILHDDLDKSMLDFIEEKFKIVSNGNVIPILPKILTIQRWSEISNSWDNLDKDKNIKIPFLALIRKPDPQPLTSTFSTIPNRKNFFYKEINTFNGSEYISEVFKIPQPVYVEITYDLFIITNSFNDINNLNRRVLQEFASKQSYTISKGHYIPIFLNSNNDSSPINNTEGRRFYQQSYEFKLQGILIDNNEFEVLPKVNRTVLTTEKTNPIMSKSETVYKGIELNKISFKTNSSTNTYYFKEKIKTIFYVLYNNYILTKDVDYFFIPNTSRITFKEKFDNYSEFEVLYFKGLDFKDDDGNDLKIKQETFDLSTKLIILSEFSKGVVYIETDNTLLPENAYFSLVNSNQLFIISNLPSNTIIKVTYLY